MLALRFVEVSDYNFICIVIENFQTTKNTLEKLFKTGSVKRLIMFSDNRSNKTQSFLVDISVSLRVGLKFYKNSLHPKLANDTVF